MTLSPEERAKLNPWERVDAITKECDGVWAESGVTSWERNFLQNIRKWDTLSDKQNKTLLGIEQKVFYQNGDA